MIPLGGTYKKHGFFYELIERRGDLAIYKQRLRPGVGELAYEVIRIQQDPDRIMCGNLIPAHERPPGDEQWGRQGWTLPTLEDAKRKMKSVERADEEKARQKRKTL